MIRIGTAGWSIPKPHAEQFPQPGTHLQRYARRFSAVEINSSFYRPHKPETYARWAESVPPGFRFAVKVPREITHTRKLPGIAEPLDRFLSQIYPLGDRLGPLLVQLPPSLQFDPATANRFLEDLRARFDGPVVCEPRHLSWFADPVEAMLDHHRIARVAADPAPAPSAATPGGWLGLHYYRLHGSPRIYYSGYAPAFLEATANRVRGSSARDCWCIFDNTALGEATDNALALLGMLD